MKLYAIIVCYKPDFVSLKLLCGHLANNSCNIIIVDNTEDGENKLFVEGCTIISLNKNKGIAYAQNVGISQALKLGAEIIVFFDQDSKIGDDFLDNILAPVKLGIPMVVSPVAIDAKQNYEYPTFKLNRIGLLKKVYSKNNLEPYPTDVVISSGLAATSQTFEIAGMMDVDFFIDFVDIEWSLRCRKNNVPILVVPKARMLHSVGEKSVNMGIIRGFIHNSTRSYYKLRNPFLLLRKKDVPKLMAFKEIVAAMVHQAILMPVVTNRREHFKNYFTSIWHGILGVIGKKPE